MANKMITVIGTVANKVSSLPIKDGQIIFVKDKKKVALDLDGKRTFYNQIELLETEQDRLDLLAPINGCFYFVVNTAVLWFYQDDWVQLTTTPHDVVFFGTKIPELGKVNTLYVDREEGNEGIRIWDETTKQYITIADKTHSMSTSDVLALFN